MCVYVLCVQVVLLLAAFVAVPWMLLPKPLILNARFKAIQVRACSHAASPSMSRRGSIHPCCGQQDAPCVLRLA